VAGADWPNTVAPPAPVTLTVHGGSLQLPTRSGALDHRTTPTFAPGAAVSGEDAAAVSWTTTDDVLRRTTTCSVRHGSTYDTNHEGTATEEYAGAVTVDRRTFAQRAEADCTFRLAWPDIDVRVASTMRVGVTAEGYDVAIEAQAFEGDEPVGRRSWSERLPR
jgi:hypothetical protein